MRIVAWLTLIAAALVFGVLVGCGGAQTTEDTTTGGGAEQTDAAVQPDPAGDAGPAEAAPTAEALVAERCTTCHNMDPITAEIAENPGREEWLRIVNDMVSRGANLNEQERDAVVDYLASR